MIFARKFAQMYVNEMMTHDRGIRKKAYKKVTKKEKEKI